MVNSIVLEIAAFAHNNPLVGEQHGKRHMRHAAHTVHLFGAAQQLHRVGQLPRFHLGRTALLHVALDQGAKMSAGFSGSRQIAAFQKVENLQHEVVRGFVLEKGGPLVKGNRFLLLLLDSAAVLRRRRRR